MFNQTGLIIINDLVLNNLLKMATYLIGGSKENVPIGQDWVVQYFKAIKISHDILFSEHKTTLLTSVASKEVYFTTYQSEFNFLNTFHKASRGLTIKSPLTSQWSNDGQK